MGRDAWARVSVNLDGGSAMRLDTPPCKRGPISWDREVCVGCGGEVTIPRNADRRDASPVECSLTFATGCYALNLLPDGAMLPILAP
jgi:hypothetical protein